MLCNEKKLGTGEDFVVICAEFLRNSVVLLDVNMTEVELLKV